MRIPWAWPTLGQGRGPGTRSIPAAWYFGRHRSKLNQSIALLAAYSLVFVVASILISLAYAKGEAYELPAGGGGGGAGGGEQQQMAMAQTVRLKKVIKKKFVINPFSAIKFGDAEIDDVKLQLEEKTDHLYKVGFGQGGAGSGKGKGFGYGDGEGSGFGSGTGAGKIRLIRLEYPGGDWNQDFGVGADLNMLIEYGIRTQQKVSDRTESRTVAQLAAFPPEKSPPMIYLTGQKNITLSKADTKSLRSYLLDKHGMLFGDNGGSRHFHNQFFAMMRQVLPEVEPVKRAAGRRDPPGAVSVAVSSLCGAARRQGRLGLEGRRPLGLLLSSRRHRRRLERRPFRACRARCGTPATAWAAT